MALFASGDYTSVQAWTSFPCSSEHDNKLLAFCPEVLLYNRIRKLHGKTKHDDHFLSLFYGYYTPDPGACKCHGMTLRSCYAFQASLCSITGNKLGLFDYVDVSLYDTSIDGEI